MHTLIKVLSSAHRSSLGVSSMMKNFIDRTRDAFDDSQSVHPDKKKVSWFVKSHSTNLLSIYTSTGLHHGLPNRIRV